MKDVNRLAQGDSPIARPAGLGNEVYEFLLQRLMSLAIAPNERIGVDALARELGVSQTPIRSFGAMASDMRRCSKNS